MKSASLCDIFIIHSLKNEEILKNNYAKQPQPFTLAFLRMGGQTRSTQSELRRAVRAVIALNGVYLMVHSSVFGEFKFPGGGVSCGERHLAALARELREETGYQLNMVIRLMGVTIELDLPQQVGFKPFRMISYYYHCIIDPDCFEPDPDSEEIKMGYHPVWVPLADALANNERLLKEAVSSQLFWLARETAVLRKLTTHEFNSFV
jgi:8-oxo-dGTP pyrophosphatase MutT (NUDIX family)